MLPEREVTVETALSQIEKQTPYKIAVNWENLDAQKTVQLSSDGLTVKELLDKALAGSGCRWEMTGDQIVIVREDNSDKDQIPPPFSAIYRSRMLSQMSLIPDPRSSRQISTEELARMHSGFWLSDKGGVDSVSLAILNFRVISTTLEKNFMDNARTLDMIDRTFSEKDALAAIDFITITGAASPEGNTGRNAQLAAGRAQAVKTYLMWKYPFLDHDRIFAFSIGEDWTGLRRMVSEDPNVPRRSEVLSILDSDRDGDAKRSALKTLGGGGAWGYISSNMLPKLRGAAACMIYFKYREGAAAPVRTDTVRVYEKQKDTVYIDRYHEKEKIVEVEKTPSGDIMVPGAGGNGAPYWWAVKTNLLYDAALLPDLAVEFSIGSKYSFEMNAQWSWWTWNRPQDHHYNCWRIQIVGIEGRYWLGNRDHRTPLTGHHIGLYGMAGTYDVRWRGGTGYLSNMSRSIGITYGYTLPIARSWSFEFGLGVGYMSGKYDTYHYDPATGHFPRENTFNGSYFGPTKARISLMWLPGGKNDMKKKK